MTKILCTCYQQLRYFGRPPKHKGARTTTYALVYFGPSVLPTLFGRDPSSLATRLVPFLFTLSSRARTNEVRSDIREGIVNAPDIIYLSCLRKHELTVQMNMINIECLCVFLGCILVCCYREDFNDKSVN